MAQINNTEDIQISPEKQKTKLPSIYKVIILNDDYTPMAVSYTHLTLPTKA